MCPAPRSPPRCHRSSITTSGAPAPSPPTSSTGRVDDRLRQGCVPANSVVAGLRYRFRSDVPACRPGQGQQGRYVPLSPRLLEHRRVLAPSTPAAVPHSTPRPRDEPSDARAHLRRQSWPASARPAGFIRNGPACSPAWRPSQRRLGHSSIRPPCATCTSLAKTSATPSPLDMRSFRVPPGPERWPMPPTQRWPPGRRWRSPTSCASAPAPIGTPIGSRSSSTASSTRCELPHRRAFKACCDHCGAVTQYASCRNRHCPSARRWRKPDGSSASAQNSSTSATGTSCSPFNSPRAIPPSSTGFNAASKTLLEFGRNPRWPGELGITMVLHTWGQNLGQHIHVHCVVTDGALSPDRECWLTPVRRGFLFPTAALSKVFRGKYLDLLSDAHRTGELRMPGDDGLDDTRAFDSLKTSLQSNDWVVYTKAPFGRRQRPRLPRALHPQERHRASSTSSRACSVPLARLRPRQQAQGHASRRRRVHPPIPPARAPARIHPAASLRIARQSRARSKARAVPSLARTARPRAA